MPIPQKWYNKYLSGFIKLSIVLVSCLFITREFLKIGRQEFATVFFDAFSDGSNVLILLSVFLLMILNWFIETYKWRFLVIRLEEINYIKSFQAVLSGVSVSIFTPNRIGDYAGRIFFLEKADRLKAIILTWIGNMSQLACTLIVGLISLLFFLSNYPDSLQIPALTLKSIKIISFILMIIVLVIFFSLAKIHFIFSGKKKFKRISNITEVLLNIGRFDLTKVLGLSMMRYFISCFQYLMMLSFFNSQAGFLEGIMVVSLIFLSVSTIPTFALAELSIRVPMAIFFFKFIDPQVSPIIYASFAVWIINLAIPAIIGFFFLQKINFIRKKDA